VIDLGPQPLAEFTDPDERWRLVDLVAVACGRCGLLQLDPTGDPQRNAAPQRHGHSARQSSTAMRHVAAFGRDIRRRLPGIGTRRPRIFDIESGDGLLLAELQRTGASVSGMDSDAAAATAASAAGIPTRHVPTAAQTAHLRSDRAPADVVIANHALAHLDDLDGAVEGIAALLDPRGIAVIEFHDASMVLRGQFDILGHAHRTYLSLSTLLPVIRRHGLAPIDASRHRLHGGSVRLWVAPARHAVASPGLDRVLDRAAVTDTDARRAAASGGLQQQADRVRRDLRSFLGVEAGANRTVAGYGAPGRGVTLLNFAGLRSTDVPFVVDRHPAKHGRVIAGTGIPIEPLDVLAARRPDDLLILPWPLAAEIRSQLADGPWNGRTIVALPRLRIA